MSGHIHLDPIGGIAGDMFVAAMLDAFPDHAPKVFADVAAVLPAGVSAACHPMTTNAMAAQGFAVHGIPADSATHAHYTALRQRIEVARLSAGTAEAATAILSRLAQAEAAVHGVALEAVHFHEVGDWDSLGDVVAAGSIIAALTGWTWSVGPLPQGSGIVQTRHGPLPVPAPATAHLLQGFTFRDDTVGGERVTPTGAAILASLAPGARRPGTLAAVGTGAGTRTLPGIANILRALAFTPAEGIADEAIAVITFAVDDMTGEEIAVAANHLRAEADVLDLALTQRLGKKGRPEHAFELLVRPHALHAVAQRCFEETATIGLRTRHEVRLTLPRTLSADTPGAVRTKTVTRPGGTTVKA
ncbi:MAG: LarC family nickel insertion protein, partial [Pseudomonadota bacterium]